MPTTSHNRRWGLESKIVYGFASFFVLLIIIACASAFYIQRFNLTSYWVAHTHAVISQLEQSYALLSQVEASQRGYIISRDPGFLQRRDRDMQLLHQSMALTKQLTSDNALQADHLVQVELMLKQRESTLAGLVQQLPPVESLTGGSKADLVRRDELLPIRNLFDTMIKREKQLLEQRSRDEAQHARELTVIVSVLFVSIVVFVSFLMMRIRRDLRLRQEAADEQKRLTDILDSSPDLIANANLQGEYFYLNRGGRELLGITMEEDILHQKISRMRPEWAIDVIYNEAIPSAIKNGVWMGETAFISRSGQEIPVSQVVVVHRNQHGTPTHLSTVVRDIRKSKQIERDLTDAALYDQTHSAVLRLFNANYDRAHILAGMLDILAQHHHFPVSAIYRYDEWSGSYQMESAHAAPAGLQKFFRLGEGLMGEAAQENHSSIFSDLDGSNSLTIETALFSMQPAAVLICPVNYQDKRMAVIVLAASRPVTDRDQQFIERLGGQLGVALHNIQQYGDLKMLAEQLRIRSEEISHKNDQLEEASRMKSEFLATMSHELRTPLNAIIGFSEIIRDGLVGEVNPQQKEYANDIFDSGQHLLALINDVLDLSKVEAGRMQLEAEMIGVPMLIESSLSIVKEKAVSNRVRLSCEETGTIGDAWLDPRKVKQILYNLLSNAVKFTPQGGQVTVKTSLVEREAALAQLHQDNPACALGEGLQFLQISVSDTGIGIAQEDMALLFQPFVQLESSLSRRFEGTGLGLAMVRKLAELHGGAVSVRSQPNAGSTFTVWLHYLPQPPEHQHLAVTSTPHGESDALPLAPSVLVIEDDDKAADLIRMQLEADGCKVTRTASAETALAILENGVIPNLITLDILLPGMDGWEFLAKLKQNPQLDHIPVVILSVVADSNKGLSLGASKVLQKPVSANDLLNALLQLGFVKPGLQEKDVRVLVVDDDPKAVEIISTYLERDGYTILRAYGGEEAKQLAKLRLPDLIVLDLMMPEVNGFDVVEALKLDRATASIPVIAVTAKFLSAAERNLLNGDVMAIMEKSEFNHGNFISEVHRALGNHPGKEV